VYYFTLIVFVINRKTCC